MGIKLRYPLIFTFVKAWGHENFFSRWCNAKCSIPPTQGKKCVSHGFIFYFMGQKVREILSQVRKQRFSIVSPPKIRFFWGDLYFLSEITLGFTKISIFICTIPLFLNCLEAVQGYPNAKSYFFICCVATLEIVSGWWEGAYCIAPTQKKTSRVPKPL